MSIYEHLGVRPIINVAGTFTIFGGALMEKEVLEAMNEAARYSVNLEELQAAASKVIAQVTHAEAGIVTAGASAALTLGTAACIAGFDVARMNRLPDTTGMPNEVIKPRYQMSNYDHAIRLAGAKMIWVGKPTSATKWDIESVITKNTVAIAYGFGRQPLLDEVTKIGKKYNIPVIVDAAAGVPPVENLYKFIDMGVDLVCISGGKSIRGFQASGILCGRKDLIASAVVQMLDVDLATGAFGEWNPPASLIPKDRLRGKLEQGIGRGMKVTKEAVVGLLVALQNLTEEKVAKETEHLRQLLEDIATRLEGIAGVEVRMTEYHKGGYPMLEVKINEQVAGRSAAEVSQRLKYREPSIYVREMYLYRGIIIVDPISLDEETAKVVGERLYTAITG
ncbi:D-glucosaminate-6-phosphate ammonia lyase [subsurface metagenome]